MCVGGGLCVCVGGGGGVCVCVCVGGSVCVPLVLQQNRLPRRWIFYELYMIRFLQ